MNFTCRSCNNPVFIVPGDRPPPWCSKCGADFKPDDPRFLALAAAAEPEHLPVPAPPRPGKPGPQTESRPVEQAAPPEPAREPEVTSDSDYLTRGMQLVGVVLLGVALLFAGEAWNFTRTAHATEGRVIRVMRSESDVLGILHEEKALQYEFNRTHYHMPPGDREEGERVPVIFQPDDPQQARVNTPRSLYQWPLLLGAAGLMLLVSGVLLDGLTSGNRAARIPTPRADA
jgi:hypothetical protein